MTSVCFVCLGNICRSPTAEAVMRHLLERAGLSHEIRVDSAGTGAWHVGEAPDARSASAARRRGIIMSGAARQFTAADFERFDHVIAMDRSNLEELRVLAPDDRARGKLRLLRSFDPAFDPNATEHLDVPDPYYGGHGGFEDVLDICEAACRGLLDELARARR